MEDGERLDVLRSRCVAWTGGALDEVAAGGRRPLWQPFWRKPKAPSGWRSFEGPAAVYVASAAVGVGPRILVSRPKADEGSSLLDPVKRLAKRSALALLAVVVAFLASLALRDGKSIADAPAELAHATAAILAAYRTFRHGLDAVSRATHAASTEFNRASDGDDSGAFVNYYDDDASSPI